MYEDKKWLLQGPSRELVEYVIKRFDPNPESGTRLMKQYGMAVCDLKP